MRSAAPIWCGFFAKKKYKLSGIVGRDGAVLIPVSSVSDTAMRPNLIHKRKIDSAWHSLFRPVPSPGLLETSKRAASSCRLIILTVAVGGLGAEKPFVAVQNLATDYLRGATSLDHHVKDILPRLRNAVLF